MFGFGKRKEAVDYDDDYVYDDDYDYDDEQEELFEDYEERKPAAKGGRRIKEFREVRERPNDVVYDEYENLRSSMEDDQELRQEVQRLEEAVQRLTSQLEMKQGELNRLSSSVADKEQQSASMLDQVKKESLVLQKQLSASEAKEQAYRQEIKELKESLDKEISVFTDQIEELEKQTKQQEGMKNDLAEIIIEAKSQGKEIVERAHWEANRIREQAEADARKTIADANLDLRMIKQEAVQYRERLLAFREETGILLEKLIASSDYVGQHEISTP